MDMNNNIKSESVPKEPPKGLPSDGYTKLGIFKSEKMQQQISRDQLDAQHENENIATPTLGDGNLNILLQALMKQTHNRKRSP
ncbi:hypothetical protein RND71_007116 [Anisodus tanguticus]|uniref:Uncharacterized protein n=1 Tax=Anisodus tanguticus TaxID=243964 RepID=A0AAE1SLR6_9SOLA|nr:hypothetical protein RND71_007116 [Anisodus tanguticus]